MRFSDRRARFNRAVVNPLFRPICGLVPMWSIVEHTGRRSGAVYRTPVSMFRTADGVAVLLPYGTRRDWVRNLQAADGGRVTVGGKTFAVTDPQVVPTGDVLPLLKAPWRQLLGRAGVPHTLLLTRA